MIINSGVDMVLEIVCLEARSIRFNMLILLDTISTLFISTVVLISGCVFIYSSSYILIDRVNNRFAILVIIFVISIALLIFSPRIIRLLLGWDGLGVRSYLLVCYYRREKRYNASILTAITNRVGDIGILLIISLCVNSAIFDFPLIGFSNYYYSWPVVFVLITAITKSAQVPFSAWLPAAIAAPTPVSALVHSSTLVTAGVYLIIRFNFRSDNILNLIIMIIISCITIIMAGVSATIELDMKKVIALSTLRQLGVIVFTLSMGMVSQRFFHLIRHAYFKAIIFIGAGALIHRIGDYQDIRKMGLLPESMVFIWSTFLIASIRLIGIPFMRGFYSKDLIIEMIFIRRVNMIRFAGIILATFMTALYSVRVLVLIFKTWTKRETLVIISDCHDRLCFGVIILIIPSIAGGYCVTSLSEYRSLISLPIWFKLFTITTITTLIFSMSIISKFISPYSPILSILHQMWFLPVTIRPSITSRSSHYITFYGISIEKGWLIVIFGGLNKAITNSYFILTMRALLIISNGFFVVALMWVDIINLLINWFCNSETPSGSIFKHFDLIILNPD